QFSRVFIKEPDRGIPTANKKDTSAQPRGQQSLIFNFCWWFITSTYITMPPKRPAAPSGSTPKRARRVLTLNEKNEVLKQLDSGMSYAAVGRHFGLNESKLQREMRSKKAQTTITNFFSRRVPAIAEPAGILQQEAEAADTSQQQDVEAAGTSQQQDAVPAHTPQEDADLDSSYSSDWLCDCDMLQEDLDGIRGWTEKWMLNFHPEKSKYMRIGRTKVADQGYHMYTTIKKTTVEKDIGVVIDNKPTFSDHLAEKINKANKIIYKTRARLNLRRLSFPSRVVNNWNGLPEWVVNVETVEKFEAKLDKYRKNQE
ncbi:putative CENP-B N-terminal DNA-binding domain-containing protein 9, partial [Homarus americanus]